MKCPVDNTDLAMSDRQGIEIDYCPQCRGVWLDRGELDKLIERSSQPSGGQPDPRGYQGDDDDEYERPQRHQEEHRYEERHHDGPKHHDDYSHQKKRKKEGFLGDLFDF